MSPYAVTCLEVVQALGTTPHRLDILSKWMAHRDALRQAGFTVGQQWLDGSFVEDKVPNDLDVVTFFRSPAAYLQDPPAFILAYGHLIERNPVKQAYSLDALWVNLDLPAERIVTLTRYYFGLFSHRRVDSLWKGMLEVNLVDATEAAASAMLGGPGGP